MPVFLKEFRARLAEPGYAGLDRRLRKQLSSGKITDGTELSSVLDSLDWVDLEMQMEEMGLNPTVPVTTVRELVWLVKAIKFRDQKKRRSLTP